MKRINYETPVSTVLEVKANSVICTSPLSVMAILSGDPGTEVEWGRETYGTAVTDTWE